MMPLAGAAPEPVAGSQRVRVNLDARGYDIWIGHGLAPKSGEHLAALAPGGRVALVTDATVAERHAPTVEKSLTAAGLTVTRIVVAPGEASKSYATLIEVCEALLAARIERGDLVVALGGGVIGDLAGFAASIVRRGLRVVQMPTTLLAQVDSSVGGKTGINSPLGKNLIGAFHQPSLVLADTDWLDSLPVRDRRAGYAEIVKYGLLGDAGFFTWCEQYGREVIHGGPARDMAVAQSCRAKAAIVMRDEREDGERALLNLGHTFGHALERHVGYDGARLVHGEAVAIGLAMAARFSARLDLLPEMEADRIERHLRSVGLPTRLADVPGGAGDAASLIDAMRQDKKVARGTLTFILLEGIGRAVVRRDVPEAVLAAFLNAERTLETADA